MFFILDSWLDKKLPSIRVINKETGQSVLEFKGEEVELLLGEQVIDIEDLHFRNADVEKENINKLFVYAKQKNYGLLEKQKALYVSDSDKRINNRVLVNTFNRFEFLQRLFFNNNPLKPFKSIDNSI